MCFSAEASFTAAAVLGVIGGITLKQTESKNMLYLAAIPFLFALQQLSEGFLWLFMQNGQQASFEANAAMYIYMFFAFTLWLVWMPLAFRIAEPDAQRRKRMLIPLALGISLGTINLIQIITHQVDAAVIEHSIVYNLHFQIPLWIYFSSILVYLAAVFMPPFMSSLKGSRLFGTLFAIAFLGSYYVYIYAFASIWCFFSAIFSIFIYKLVKDNDVVLEPKLVPEKKGQD